VSNVGKWDTAYADASTDPQPYGASRSYELGAAALADCVTVEDWGCGLGWFKQFLPDTVTYVGVDGSASPHADVVDDLLTRQTTVEGIFMRHVLEHNYDWELVLDNALASFTGRMVLVVFTPWTKQVPHHELRFEDAYSVPTLALNRRTLVDHFEGFDWRQETIESPETFYGWEAVFTIGRP
jgi:hypothetical protein